MDLLLNCTFDYQEHIQMHNVKLEWFYIPKGGTEENSIFFYYQNLSTVAQDSKFTQRLKWVGDIRKKNGSILISDMNCTDNGNFICDLRIPRVSSQVYKSKTHLIVLCEDSMRSRAMNSHVSKEVIPKNIIYTSAGISTIFIALSVILIIIWKHPSCTPPRNQSICDPPGRNETGALENIKETDGYFTVTRQPALLSNKESTPTEEKQNEETKKDEDEIYVTMHAFLGTGKSDKPAS
ncbi:myelin protein zero-like protein 3 [Pristis pectinata]|uniref:myelin protein zero-like protein 3 n=1 Tax=Pristis pectinata TaxID=685728 RepID=UPI00223DD38F|nr:myelin protein zero-like protein 3 [Pristis pectinata]XP_051896072.1 myelin protein zero-like protein 3 [Pristis pectinata]